MEEFFGIVLIRGIVREVGQYSRYFFFRIIGKKRSLKSLSNESKDEYRDMATALTQDFFNAVTGIIVLCVISLVIVTLAVG